MAHIIATNLRPNIKSSKLVVADLGTNPHHLNIRMGNKTMAPVLDQGSAIISLNGKLILIQDALYIPAQRSPLYNLHAHMK